MVSAKSLHIDTNNRSQRTKIKFKHLSLNLGGFQCNYVGNVCMQKRRSDILLIKPSWYQLSIVICSFA